MLRGPVEELPQEEIDRCFAWFRKNYGQSGQKKVAE
jgi:L-ribulose-5-phosphate 4-epimerase